MPHVTGIGGGIDPRTPIGFGSAAAGADVLIFALGQLRGLLNADDVVFLAEIGVDIFFALIMAQANLRTVGEFQFTTRGAVFMIQPGEQALAIIFQVLGIGFADFAQKQAAKSRHPLTIVGSHLGEQPVGFTAAACAAIADGARPIRLITQPGGGASEQLADLHNLTGIGQVE